ncbi:hypothetical protein MF1_01200 [Bartonella quintana]|nr:hypothetical protein MF1_01200 [Bartonella quintana]
MQLSPDKKTITGFVCEENIVSQDNSSTPYIPYTSYATTTTLKYQQWFFMFEMAKN